MNEIEHIQRVEMLQARNHINGSKSEVEKLNRENEDLRAQLDRLRSNSSGSSAPLHEENQRLNEELRRLKANSAPQDSEGRLRAALNKRGITTAELRQAIQEVESLVDQARRELKQAEIREKRASYEALHSAVRAEDEVDLQLQIDLAKLNNVDAEEIAKAEAKLADLQAMSPEEKASKAEKKKASQQKKDAFIYIKRDDVESLQKLIESLDESVRWKEWKDYNARDLWKTAVHLRASSVQRYLAPIFGQKLPEEAAQERPNAKRSSMLSLDSLNEKSVIDVVRAERQNSSGSGGTPKAQGGSPNTVGFAADADSEKQAEEYGIIVHSSKDKPWYMGLDLNAKLVILSIGDGPVADWNSPWIDAGLDERICSVGDTVVEVDGVRENITLMRPDGEGTHTMTLRLLRTSAASKQASSSAPPAHSSGRASATDLWMSGEADDPTATHMSHDDATISEGLMSPTKSEAESFQLKTKAFRAVAQDDVSALAEVLMAVHENVWKTWENKAGKDLETLAMERGSNMAYGVLMHKLGKLKELHRDAFEEREDVWVFEAGEVKPRQATVMEDTPAEADEVLVEFWDGDEPASHVDRCMIHKMHNG